MARPKVRDELKALNVKIDAKVYDRLNIESLNTGIPKTILAEKAIKEFLNNRNQKIIDTRK